MPRLYGSATYSTVSLGCESTAGSRLNCNLWDLYGGWVGVCTLGQTVSNHTFELQKLDCVLERSWISQATGITRCISEVVMLCVPHR